LTLRPPAHYPSGDASWPLRTRLFCRGRNRREHRSPEGHRRAQKFAAKNQFDKAVVEYQRVLREDPSDVRILLKVGDLQVRMNARAAAVETYTRVAQPTTSRASS
jgi:hypothetical protein